MNASEVGVSRVRFSGDSLIFELEDGRTISAPLAFYPTLLYAGERERLTLEIAGDVVHWPLLDADLSAECLLQGAKEMPLYAERARRRAGMPAPARVASS